MADTQDDLRDTESPDIGEDAGDGSAPAAIPTTWADVVSHPRYQDASGAQRQSIRNTFFDRVVAPQLQKNQFDDARKAFNERTDADVHPFAGFVKNTMAKAKAVAGEVGTEIADVAQAGANQVKQAVNGIFGSDEQGVANAVTAAPDVDAAITQANNASLGNSFFHGADGQAPMGGSTALDAVAAVPKAVDYLKDVATNPQARRATEFDLKSGIASEGARTLSWLGKMAVGATEILLDHAGNVSGDDETTRAGNPVRWLAEKAERLDRISKALQPRTLLGSAAQIPLQVATLPLQPAMAGSEKYESLTDAGVDKKTAFEIASGTFALNAASNLFPVGKGIIKGALAGAGANVTSYAADARLTQLMLAGDYQKIADDYGFKKDDLIKTGLMGLMMGAAIGHVTHQTEALHSLTERLDDVAKVDPEQAHEVVENISDPAVKQTFEERLNAHLADQSPFADIQAAGTEPEIGNAKPEFGNQAPMSDLDTAIAASQHAAEPTAEAQAPLATQEQPTAPPINPVKTPKGQISTDSVLGEINAAGPDGMASRSATWKMIAKRLVRDGKATLVDDRFVSTEPQVPTDNAVKFSASHAPTFYSATERNIDALSQAKAPPEQWKAILNNLTAKGVKPEEVKWLGINDWLDEQKGSVSKEQIVDYLRSNKIRVDEKLLGESGSEKYRLAAQRAAELNEKQQSLWRELHETLPKMSQVDEANLPRWGMEMHGFTSEAQAAEAKARSAGLNDEQISKLAQYGAAQLEYKDAKDDADRLRKNKETKYERYTLPGGENYRELLLTIPTSERGKPEPLTKLPEGYDPIIDDQQSADRRWAVTPPGQASARPMGDRHATKEAALSEALQLVNNERLSTWAYEREKGEFKSSHFDQPNILAHIRFNDRTDSDGKRVLFLEEIQSDWAQTGKRSGFLSSVDTNGWTAKPSDSGWWKVYGRTGEFMREVRATSESGAIEDVGREFGSGAVPSAPFVTKTDSWVALAIKRMIRYAAENGYDRIAWTTGEQQADRYDLSKQVDAVRYTKSLGGMLLIKEKGKSGWIEIAKGIPEDKLSDYVGKDAAEKISNMQFSDTGGVQAKTLSGIDLKVGGEGMKAFYDDIVPAIVNKYVKKWGAKVGETTIPTDEKSKTGFAAHSIDITPQMKDSVLQGQPLFSARQPVPQSNPSQELSGFWKTVADQDRTFQYKTTDATDFRQIVKDMSGGRGWLSDNLEGKRLRLYIDRNSSPYLEIKLADTDHPYVVIGEKGNEGIGGSLAYQIAMTWAHNNGKTLQPDKTITMTNRLRRTEAMISSALRFNTTEHLMPHRDQYVGLLSKADYAALREDSQRPLYTPNNPEIVNKLNDLRDRLWVKTSPDAAPATKQRIFDYNLYNLLRASSELVARREPLVDNLRFESGRGIYDVRGDDGKSSLSDGEIAELLAKEGRRPDQTGVGVNTLKRAVVTRSVLQELQQHGVLPHPLVGPQSLSDWHQRLLYSGREGRPAESVGRPEIAPELQGKVRDLEAAGAQVGFRIRAAKLLDAAVEQQPKNQDLQTLKRLQDVFGVPVVISSTEGRSPFNGAFFDGHIWVSADTEVSPHVVFGHELTHAMERENPVAYSALLEAVRPLLKNQDRYKGLTDLSAAERDKEILGDLMGDHFAKPEFWRDVEAKMPAPQFRSLIKSIVDWIGNVLAGVKNYGASKFVTDLEKTHDILSTAIARHLTDKAAATPERQALRYSVATQGRVASFIKTVADKTNELIEAYRRVPEISTMKDVVGKYTGNLQVIEHDLTKFAKTINAAIPKSRQVAITNYMQAGGDLHVLADRAAKSGGEHQQGYRDAVNLTPEEKAWADKFRQRHDLLFDMAQKAGVIEDYVENYVRGEWERPEKAGKNLIAQANAGLLRTNPREAMHKVFENYFEGEQAGYKPIDKRIGYQMIAAERSIRMALEARKAIKAMSEGTEKDGRPTVTVSGAGSPTEISDAEKPYMINPNIKAKDTSDYRYLDHPALRRWKWIGKDDAGKPIFLQGNMWIHPDAYKSINALLGQSKIKTYTIPERIPLIGGTQPGHAMLNAGSFIKGTVLIGPFHQFHVGEHALFHGVNPFATPEIDFQARPVLREGVEHGLMLFNHRALAEFSEGVGSGGLFHRVPIIKDVLTRYQSYLFQDFIPRLKAAMFEHAVARAEKYYADDLKSGKLTRGQLLENAAKQANAAFGELNYKYMGRDPTMQDAMRIVLLAPDFLEARFKFFGQAARPLGREQARAFVIGAVVMSATAQAVNIMFGDDHKPNWSKPFSIILGGREYTPRSVVGDLVHLVSDPRGFWYHRLNPLWGRPLIELASGRNQYGQKVDIGEASKDILKSWTPLPGQGFFKKNMGDTQMGSIINGLLQSVGVSNYPYKSEAQRKIAEIGAGHLPIGGFTPIEKARHDAFGELLDAVKSGDKSLMQAVHEARQENLRLTPSQITNLRFAANPAIPERRKLMQSMRAFNAEEVMQVWDQMDATERAEMRGFVLKKIGGSKTLPIKQKMELQAQVRQQ